MAELADAHGSGPCESDFMQVQVLLSAPHRSKGNLCSVFLCPKNIRSLPCSSFFTKSHARLICSVVNAFTTTRCRYQLFVSLIQIHYEHSHYIGAKEIFAPIFCIKKSRNYRVIFQRLSDKKSSLHTYLFVLLPTLIIYCLFFH